MERKGKIKLKQKQEAINENENENNRNAREEGDKHEIIQVSNKKIITREFKRKRGHY